MLSSARARRTVYLFEQFMFNWKGPIALSEFSESESGSSSGNYWISIGPEQGEKGNDDLAEKNGRGTLTMRENFKPETFTFVALCLVYSWSRKDTFNLNDFAKTKSTSSEFFEHSGDNDSLFNVDTEPVWLRASFELSRFQE